MVIFTQTFSWDRRSQVTLFAGYFWVCFPWLLVSLFTAMSHIVSSAVSCAHQSCIHPSFTFGLALLLSSDSHPLMCHATLVNTAKTSFVLYQDMRHWCLSRTACERGNLIMRYKCLDQLKVDSGFFHDIADVKCVDIGCTWMSDKAWMVV